jgi:hypothetical protein
MRCPPIWPAVLLLAGCDDGADAIPEELRDTVAVFEPSTGDIPIPNDVLFLGSVDFTLNIPVANAADGADPKVALNALDGWSTSAPFHVRFTRPIDPASLVPAATVHLFEVTVDTSSAPVGGPVTGVVGELTAADYALGFSAGDASGATVEVRPTAPLSPSTPYMLVVTDGVLDSEGFPVARDGEYELASAPTPLPANHPFAALQSLTLAMQAAAGSAGVEPARIVLTTTFTTQSIGAALATVGTALLGFEGAIVAALCGSGLLDCSSGTANLINLPAATVNPASVGTTATFVPGSPGAADVYVGELTLPYFLTGAADAFDTAPLAVPWQARYAPLATPERNLTSYNSLPAPTGDESVPLLVTVPILVPKPPGGWPVTLFQHGITRARTDALAVADALAAIDATGDLVPDVGRVVLAIDLPLHGVDGASPFFTSFAPGGTRERTFGLDLVDNATGAPGPDGNVDSSGAHFANLADLLVGRDNLGQGVVDLMALRTVLATLDIDGDLTPDLDVSDVTFFGHSLGAMLGVPHLAIATDIGFPTLTSTLGMPGGGIAKLFNGSETLGPTVRAGLAASGVLEGTPDFEAFLFAAQTVLDTVDPINHAATASALGTPLHLVEVIGGGPGGGLPDDVIPNCVPDAPLSGTDALITALGLTLVTNATGDYNASPAQAAVRFIEGLHSSVINPGMTPAELAAFLELQSQAVIFATSGGTLVDITDGSVTQ